MTFHITPSKRQDPNSRLGPQNEVLPAYVDPNRSISRRANSALMTFHKFPEMPLEIRDTVWAFALEVSHIHRITAREPSPDASPYDPSPFPVQSNCPSSRLLHTCRESRRVASLRYRQHHKTPISSTQTYFFDYASDIFFIAVRKDFLYPIMDYAVEHLRGDKIQHLAIQRGQIPTVVSKDHRWAVGLWKLFSTLKTLTVVIEEDNEEYPDCSLSEEDRKDLVFMDEQWIFRSNYLDLGIMIDHDNATIKSQWSNWQSAEREIWSAQTYLARYITAFRGDEDMYDDPGNPAGVSRLEIPKIELRYVVPRLLKQKIDTVKKELEKSDELNRQRLEASKATARYHAPSITESVENNVYWEWQDCPDSVET